MRIGDVLRSLAGGVVVYLLATACADGAKDPDNSGTMPTAGGGSSGNGKDTGGQPSMNGDAGSHSGSGAVANAAGADGAGGDEPGGCECPVLPGPEPDVRIERDCSVSASSGTQKFAALSIPGASLGDLSRVRAVYLSGDVTPWPSGTVGLANTMVYGEATIWSACALKTTDKVAFFVPADLAEGVQ